MTRVFDRTYLGLRRRWPKASMIRPVQGGFEGYVFEDEPKRTTQDNRYTQHTFMDKG